MTTNQEFIIEYRDMPGGKLHRTDGPAVSSTNGRKEFYIDGRKPDDFEMFVLFPEDYKSGDDNGN